MTRFASTIVASAFLATAALPALAQGGAQYPERYAVGHILVQPRPGLSLAELEKAVKPHGGRRAGSIKQINVHVIELPPQANALAVAEALRKNRNLKFAEVDAAFSPDFYPNDPRYPVQWHLPKVGASAAWDSAQGNGIVIAILDSGVDLTHPDLQQQLVPGWNFFDNNDDVSDVAGHGTTVAGVAGAAANNSTGVASMSFGARIMPMRITDAAGSGYSSLIASALVTAADNGAKVANISFLGVSYSSTVDSAAQYMRSKGGVVVTSSGNTGVLRSDPPRSSLTVVAATDSSDAKASFSSWGDYVDIAAPGVSISTTTRGGGYGSASGTSASAPVVAGVYALMMSAKPGLSPATLDSIVFSTAQDLGSAGWDQQFGNGRVNAQAAVSKALQASGGDSVPPSVAITSPTGGSAMGLVPVDVNATDDIGVTRVELYANNALVASDTTSPYGFSLDSSKYTGTVTLEARAYDAAGNTGNSAAVSLSVSNDKQAPTVSILSPSSGSTVSGTITVSVSAMDNEKVASVTLNIDGKDVAVSYGTSLRFSWNVPRVKGKQSPYSTITARALDAAGNTGSSSIRVTRR